MADWLADAPILLIALLVFVGGLSAGLIGYALRWWPNPKWATAATPTDTGQEGYIVSGVLGLLAILLGFTLAMSVDRFDTRRRLVLQEANAIGTTYLRAQLLPEPHRARVSDLLVAYTDNRIALAKAQVNERDTLLAQNDRLLTDLWAATAAAFDSVARLPFSNTFLETVNNLIDLDAARKASRAAHVPAEVLGMLLICVAVTAGVLGHVLIGLRSQLAGVFLVGLLSMALVLIADLDRPTSGGIRESQAPMERLRASLKAQPPEVFERWRSPQPKPGPD